MLTRVLVISALLVPLFLEGCATFSSTSASVEAPAEAPSPIRKLKIHTSMKFEGVHGGERKFSSSNVFEEGRWQLITGATPSPAAQAQGRVMILGRLREVIGETVKMEYLILDGNHPGVVVSDPLLSARLSGQFGAASVGVENKKTGRVTVAFAVDPDEPKSQ